MTARASLALLALLVAAPAAHAYVPTTAGPGRPALRWPIRCVVVTPDARGDAASPDIDIDTIDQVLQTAVGTWNSGVASCSFMRLGFVPAAYALEAVSDGRPAVVFRSDVWGNSVKTYDRSAIGLTTVWYADREGDPTDGQITDADIELNAVNYTFTTNPGSAPAADGTMVADLQNTLTHELGHVLGLAHTCWDHILPDPPLDNHGQPAPDCGLGDQLPDVVRHATMYPYAAPGGISMRMLSADDVAGVCDSYSSSGAAPTACYGNIQGGGCTAGRRMSRGTLLADVALLTLCLLGMAALARRRRRRGRL